MVTANAGEFVLQNLWAKGEYNITQHL